VHDLSFANDVPPLLLLHVRDPSRRASSKFESRYADDVRCHGPMEP